VSESGFADARDAFEEEVSAGEDGDQGEADYILFAADYGT
jgi:hypothetical protein